MPSLWTRQGASAFNLPLSFDTSSVTRMNGMFQVHSAPAHATTPSGLPLQRRRLQPFSPGPPAALSACLPLDSAGHVSVQPAADLRHLQRHDHAVHVFRALRACPCHPLTRRAHAARHLGHRTQRPPVSWPACRPLIYALPLDSRQSASAFNQPLSINTSSVVYMSGMFQVRSAPALATCSPVGPTPRVT